ncbi:hillarin-like [Mizuhopecten yessoensis]|uniref:hillarin-like n=1 Tax=Mizuhopecten yessoensis TaxID=6573 RepID=UPI000B45C125|nr:hillarin-like [Mizuhopecten yessoensis]
MGCGSSSGTNDVTINTKSKNSGRNILVEPLTDPADFPYIPEGYPPPKPSRTKKATLFDESKYTNIEKRAIDAPEAAGNSYTELFEHLFNGLNKNLEKVRAIFCWIGHKNQTPCKGGPDDSPNAILQQVQNANMSFAYMFARLCREANIPCVIIRGVAKSARYEVGDDEAKVSELNNRWNGVFVAGEWRIVFPQWAFSALAGHSTGKFTLVEAEGNAAREKQTKSTGVSIVQLNEYYFLPDPEDFVHEAMATEPKWQFIAKQFNMKKFCSVPLLQESYFDHNVEITYGFNSRLYSEYGVVTVGFKARNEKWESFLTYELYFNDEESDSVLPTDLQLDRYVVMERNFEKWTFSIRCPVTGVYKLCIYSESSATKTLLCEFKMFCDEVTVGGTKALPLNVGPIGWGPSNEMVKAGLTTPSQSKGIVKATAKKEVNFSFTCSRTVAIRTVLVHNETSTEELQSYVSHKRDKKSNKLNVAVCVPDEGEYALQIHTKDKNTNKELNACNYIISTEPTPQQKKKKKKKRENVTERKARDDLKMTSTGNDLEILTISIAKFQTMGLEDKGDLEDALKRQNVLKLEKGLNEAIMRRHIDILDTAIDKAEKSEFKSQLAPKIGEADQVRQELIKLNRFAHDILAMRQPTVSELHSYKIPKPPVKDVMVATFTLLGESKDNLEVWQDIKTLLRRVGPNSLMRRVRQFPEKQAHNVDESTAKEVQNMIRVYEEDTVRLCSPAAGTFYVWVNNIVTDIIENGNTRNKGT